VIWRVLVVTLVLECVACGGSPTNPTQSSINPFPAFDWTPMRLGEVVPNYVGQWEGTADLGDCHAYGPVCTRASQSAHFFPPRIQLSLVQSGISLSGILTFSSVQGTAIEGTVTKDGSFVVFGSQPILDTQWYVGGKFTVVSDNQLTATIITETHFGGRLSSTFLYVGSVTRQ
jgi:hypothetical protein